MANKSTTIKELLENIDAKIAHIEDISADNRAVIIKLVKQNNQIVEFLRDLQIEEYTDEYRDMSVDLPDTASSSRNSKLKALLDDFLERREELKEFEEELKKHKDKLTPGQIGES